MKKYIWGFPGIGKSTLELPGVNIVDADSQLFEFKNVSADELHDNLAQGVFIRDENYPQNYIDYIKSVDADIVLINCHLSLLEQLDKESVLIVYPSQWLMFEYMQRYVARGDNTSFVSHMAVEAPRIIDYINHSDYKKYQVFTVDTFLSDLFERNDFKLKLMTKSELTELLQRAKDLDLLGLDEANGSLLCDLKYFDDAGVYGIPAEELAQAVFDGKYSLDVDQVLEVCAKREEQLREEKVMLERRGGLSREELEDKIMQGIVNGALGIEYSQIAPYSHGYEVTFGGDGPKGSTWKFKNRWECYCDLFEIPSKIVGFIERAQQDDRVFGKSAEAFHVRDMLSAIDAMEKECISSFVPETDAGLERRGRHMGHVASVMDVHAGKALDGIVNHHFHGDYSSMTPGRQNDLVEALVYLKGFCLDCLYENNSDKEEVKNIVEYLKKHGTDISTPEKLQNWIKKNPEKCAIEDNRHPSFDEQLLYGKAYSDFVELEAIVKNHNGTLEDLCAKLSGQNFDGELFDLNFGVLTATITQDADGKLSLNEESIDVWDDKLNHMVQECISVERLKTICADLGLDLGYLKDEGMTLFILNMRKYNAGMLGLDEVIKTCEKASKNNTACKDKGVVDKGKDR